MIARLLLIEDDPGTGSALQKVLRGEGYDVQLATRGDDGLALACSSPCDLVITDLKLPGVSGLELLTRLRAAKPKLPVILMTAHGSTDTAIEATKLGAYDYLPKPFDADSLLVLVESALGRARMMTEAIELGPVGGTDRAALVGQGRAMQALYKEIGRVAGTSAPVLIRGATGTGKELVARALYQHSDRADKPFIAVNCAAIPPGLLESELFGHERGAFTGATHRRIGRFEQAHRGTLFLDEIGDLPIESQAKLLRVLQDGVVQRVGGDEWIRVDVRVLAATHRNLEEAIREREFREDLFFRLNVIALAIPPLDERREDIPELVTYFMRRYSAAFGIANPAIHPEALALLQSMPWPGNVRELENVVRQALLGARPFPVGADHVRRVRERMGSVGTPSGEALRRWVCEALDRAESGGSVDVYWGMLGELETALFAEALARCDGNQSKAARWLGVTRLKLREAMRTPPARTEGRGG